MRWRLYGVGDLVSLIVFLLVMFATAYNAWRERKRQLSRETGQEPEQEPTLFDWEQLFQPEPQREPEPPRQPASPQPPQPSPNVLFPPAEQRPEEQVEMLPEPVLPSRKRRQPHPTVALAPEEPALRPTQPPTRRRIATPPRRKPLVFSPDPVTNGLIYAMLLERKGPLQRRLP